VKSGEEFSFAVYGDAQPNNQYHIGILNQILKTHPLFIINVGDLTQKDNEENWYDYFSVICDKTKAGETIPIYSTMGNHDQKGNVYNSLYIKYLSLPVNNFDNTEAYYSFNIGNAHFVALNNYLSFDPASPQYKWFAEDLRKSSDYKWKIVFIHEPFYSSGKHGGNMHQRRVLGPLFEKGGVTLVFSGHDHLYERTKNIKGVTYIVTGGGGAHLYNARQDESIKIIDKSRHFCKVRMAKDQCEVEMIRSDGTVGDRLILTQQNSAFSKSSDFEKRKNIGSEEDNQPLLQDASSAWSRYLYNLSVILSSGGRRFLNTKGG
jgi:3',5'-cyclic AMP phosphodiesterase CpdA